VDSPLKENILELRVPSNSERQRLDKFLSQQLTSVTRAKIKKMIDSDRITVDGRAVKASHIVQVDETIRIDFPPPEPLDVVSEPIPLDIIYEDDHLLVVNKAPGMVVHPAYGNKSGTLVNALLAHCQSLSSVGGIVRPGLVHRLDKETSGLLVVAKDDVTHVELAKQLSQYKMDREYRAVVWGHPSQSSMRIEAALGRHPKDRTRMRIDEKGKHAATTFTVLDEMTFTSYLKLVLETGRTHQIRVHLSSLGHPVFGDSVYGGKGKQLAGMNTARVKFVNRLFRKFTRHMLHAQILTFRHPATQELMTFQSPLPTDMQELLHILKSSTV